MDVDEKFDYNAFHEDKFAELLVSLTKEDILIIESALDCYRYNLICDLYHESKEDKDYGVTFETAYKSYLLYQQFTKFLGGRAETLQSLRFEEFEEYD